MKAIDLDTLPLRQMLTSQGEKLSLTADVSALFAMQHLRLYYEELLPGRRASKVHSHSHKEEIIVILAGSVSLYLGEEMIPMKAGQVFGIPPSDMVHVLVNTSENLVRYLILTQVQAQDHVTYCE